MMLSSQWFAGLANGKRRSRCRAPDRRRRGRGHSATVGRFIVSGV